MMDSVIQFRGTIYENGYGLIARKVMKDKRLPKQAKLIYAYMCSYAGTDENGNRSAFPSVSLQCDELGMGQDAYYRWRKYLVELGYITIEKQRNEHARFDRNLYIIEAVPVEKPDNPPENDETEPYPENTGTVKSSTEKTGTNSNSPISNSSNNNSNNQYIDNTDDDKRTGSPTKHNDESINNLISNFREQTKDDLTDRSFKAVVRKVMDKYNQGKVEYDLRDYLASALTNKIEKLELRRTKDQAKAELLADKQKRIQERTKQLHKTPTRPVPFYNWLEG